MRITGINKILGWVQVISNGRTYTCPTKQIDGKLLFKFNNHWHDVLKYVGETTQEFVKIDGKNITRIFKK